MAETKGSEGISTRQHEIAQLARRKPKLELTTLAHRVDLDWLREGYRRTRKDGAVGVDGQTAEEYEQDLRGNLESLLERFKAGTYRAPPVRRVHIPKGDGRRTRPIGIPTFEDKVLQRAVTMVLTAVYEQDFLDCSYGFRPGRSAHDAVRTLDRIVHRGKVNWILEADIVSFFDSLDRSKLKKMLEVRVADGSLLRLIGKCLHVGVLDGEEFTRPEVGTAQGSVLSPLLGDVYLH